MNCKETESSTSALTCCLPTGGTIQRPKEAVGARCAATVIGYTPPETDGPVPQRNHSWTRLKMPTVSESFHCIIVVSPFPQCSLVVGVSPFDPSLEFYSPNSVCLQMSPRDKAMSVYSSPLLSPSPIHSLLPSHKRYVVTTQPRT